MAVILLMCAGFVVVVKWPGAIETLLPGKSGSGEPIDLGAIFQGSSLVDSDIWATIRLPDTNGDMLSLSDYGGKVVFLNFWATWCGPCRQEIPKLTELKTLHEEYDFELLGINIDEDPNKALRLAKKLSVNFPILFDQAKQVSKTYSIDAMPMTILIDRDGKVRYVHRGYKDNYVGLYQEQIQKLKFE